MSTSQPSPLLRLPAELRLEIYTHVLSSQTFDVHYWRQYTPFSFATRILNRKKHFLALLATCRQIHAETRLLPVRLNAFRFKSHDAFTPWLERFDMDQREAIREVHLVTWMGTCMVEGESWQPVCLKDVFPVKGLPGLRRVEIEARGKSRGRDCVKDGCEGCEEHTDEGVVDDGGLKEWLLESVPGVEVTFRRVVTDAVC